MRHLLTWLTLFGVLAGLQGRVLAADPCDAIEKMHSNSHHGHHHEEGQPCDSSHDKHCPQDHHHHECFCHGMQLVPAFDSAITLRTPCTSLSRLAHEGEVAPEGPCLSEDEPPLI